MEVDKLKLRVLFLRKKYIYYFILILTVCTFFIISHLSTNNSFSTFFSINSNEKPIKADLTGDGEEDFLYITTNKNKYSIQVNTQKESLYLEPNSMLKTFGDYSLSWPIRVKLLDVSRDKIPEIFVQASQNNNPIQHVFIYNNGKFEDILCTNNNILGFIDCTSNRTPKIISGNLQQNNLTLSNYILVKNQLNKYHYSAPNTFMGKDTIMYFINFITTLSQNYVQPSSEIFDPKISSLSLISSLPYLGSNFVFQDAVFADIKSNKNGEPTQIQWILNFRGNDIKTNELKNFTIKLNLKAFDNSKDKYYFKIYSMILEGK